jgi:hypothetical protein
MSTDALPFKLGRQESVPDPRTLRLAAYAAPAMPAAPSAVDWLGRVKTWPLYRNDEIGDCEVVSCAHLVKGWTAYAGAEIEVAEADVITAYSQITGYDPRTGTPDPGIRSLDMLNHWRKNGVGGHRIAAYVEVDVRNLDEVRQAVHLFGGLLIGADMPLAAAAQTRRRETWKPVATSAGTPGSWGGHAMHLGAYGPRGLTVTTWGRTQRLTWGWWQRYVVEAYAIVSPDWLGAASGRTPTGLALDVLLADLQRITAG